MLCMVPEIWSATDRIFCHFGLYFSRLLTWKIKNFKKWKKHQEILPYYTRVPYMRIKWCMVPEIWSAMNKIFCHFGSFFCPLTTRKIKIMKKWKMPGDIIVLHTCIKNHDHMIISYTVPEIRHGTDLIYFSFWAIFCPFNPLTI